MDRASIDHLLTTTRSVRRRLDLERPVPAELIEECIEIAIQAPTGSNAQGWHFIAVTDPKEKSFIAGVYKDALMKYLSSRESAPSGWQAGDPRRAQERPLYDSVRHLAEHLHEVPVLLIACVEGRPEHMPPIQLASLYGSILPAAWSLMLALRARGLGSAWTTLHLVAEAEIARRLGIPDTYTQTVLLPVAYFKGSDFRPASRISGRECTSWNRWGARR